MLTLKRPIGAAALTIPFKSGPSRATPGKPLSRGPIIHNLIPYAPRSRRRRRRGNVRGVPPQGPHHPTRGLGEHNIHGYPYRRQACSLFNSVPDADCSYSHRWEIPVECFDFVADGHRPAEARSRLFAGTWRPAVTFYCLQAAKINARSCQLNVLHRLEAIRPITIPRPTR